MNFTPLELIKFAFAAYLAYDFVQYLRSGQLKRHLTVFAKRTPLEWAKAFLLVAAEVAVVFGIIYALWAANEKIFSWSWLNLVATPADGENPGTNLIVSSTQNKWFGPAFIILLALNIPRLARREEEIFRRGTTDFSDALIRSTKFGFMHMIVGVPIAAAVALCFSGLFFTWRYKVGRIRESSYYHSVHNLALVGYIAFLVVTGKF